MPTQTTAKEIEHLKQRYLDAINKKIAEGKIFSPDIFEQVISAPGGKQTRVHITLPIAKHTERPFTIVLYECLTKRSGDEPKFNIRVTGPGVCRSYGIESDEIARAKFEQLVARAPVWAAAYALIGGHDVEDC